jgi:hypothetical protein
MAVKKAPVDIVAKVTDTFETLMALKKVNQCNARAIPATTMNNKALFGILSENFLNDINRNIKNVAINILYQTNGKASIVISLPSMAVNPQIKTIK